MAYDQRVLHGVRKYVLHENFVLRNQVHIVQEALDRRRLNGVKTRKGQPDRYDDRYNNNLNP